MTTDRHCTAPDTSRSVIQVSMSSYDVYPKFRTARRTITCSCCSMTATKLQTTSTMFQVYPALSLSHHLKRRSHSSPLRVTEFVSMDPCSLNKALSIGFAYEKKNTERNIYSLSEPHGLYRSSTYRSSSHPTASSTYRNPSNSTALERSQLSPLIALKYRAIRN
jgi:hypothetical protein